MKQTILLLTAMVLALPFSLSAQQVTPAKEGSEPAPAKKEANQAAITGFDAEASYMIAYQTGKQLLQLIDQLEKMGVHADKNVMEKGFADAMDGKEPVVSEKRMGEIDNELRNRFTAIQKAAAEKGRKGAEANKAAGEKFLESNGKRPEVTTLPSGLQIEAVKPGEGASPKVTDTVKVDYRGTLIDGTEFDSSYKRGKPAEFRLDAVIPGWTIGLQQMKVGGEYKLYVPSKLAYGERGVPPAILPDSVLVFEVKLLDIVK